MQRVVLTSIAVAAVLVMIASSAAMNFMFLSSLGRTPIEGRILGCVSVSADTLKAIMPVFLAWGAAARRWPYVAAAGIVFVVTFAVSLSSALGYVATNRGSVLSARAEAAHRIRRIEAEMKEVNDRARSLPAHRPVGVVDAAIGVLTIDRRWLTTRECSAAASAGQRTFCDGYFRLR